MARIITIINGKGGVAKTTTAKFIVKEALSKGKKVLAIDLDPKQSNLTTGLEQEPYPSAPKAGNIMSDEEREKKAFLAYNGKHNIIKIFQGGGNPNPIHLESVHENLWFLPAAKELESAANACSSGRDLKLRNFLKSIDKDFDVIVIDTNPGITVLQNNAIVYADVLVMPAQAETNASEGMKTLFSEINSLMEEYDLNKPHDFYILPSMVFKRSTTHSIVLENFEVIGPHVKSLSMLSNKTFEILPSVPSKEVFRKADLAEGVYFVQDYINKFESAEKRAYIKKEENSTLRILEEIGNKILNTK